MNTYGWHLSNQAGELIRSTDVREIRNLIGYKSNTDFKRDVLREKRLMQKLNAHHFSLEKLWVTESDPIFECLENQG